MNEENKNILNTQKTMEKFLSQMEKKVKENTYTSKEELLNEINDFKTFISNLPKTEEIHLQNFDKQILNILQTYDEKNMNTQKQDYSNYSEFERDNQKIGATMKIDGENHTIIQAPNAEKSVWGEMKDMYNKEAIENLDKSSEIPKDKIEDNFNLLRKHTHEEVYMTNAGLTPTQNLFSVRKKALHYYSIKNNIELEFSNDGLARDKNGTMYEATVNTTGEITIYKTKTTTIVNGNPHIQEKTDLETISMYEIIAFEKTKPINEQTINFGFLDYLRNHLESYKEILEDSNNHLSQEEKDMYEDLLKEDLEQKRREEFMAQKENPKVYVLEDKKEGRNGFVNALLLSIITSLFGGLCLAYFLIGILE